MGSHLQPPGTRTTPPTRDNTVSACHSGGAFSLAARPRTVFMCVLPSVPFPLTKSLVPRSTCSYMRLCPTPILFRFTQKPSVQWSSFHPCYRPLRFVSGIIPDYRKSFSSTSSNKMLSSVENLYSASVATPKNPSGSPEDIDTKNHHLKNGFTNPWPRYICSFLLSDHMLLLLLLLFRFTSAPPSPPPPQQMWGSLKSSRSDLTPIDSV